MACPILQTGLSGILLDLALRGIGLEKGKMWMTGELGVGVGAGHLLLTGESQGRIMILRKGSVKGRMIVVGGTITLDVTSRWIEGGIDDCW